MFRHQVEFSPKILLIEDNLDFREHLVCFLELFNFNVQVVDDGLAGVALAKLYKPNLVVCDILLPNFNGYEVLKELREHPNTASIGFIFITVSSTKKEMLEGLSLGANAYLAKPFSLKNFLINIQEIVKMRVEELVY